MASTKSFFKWLARSNPRMGSNNAQQTMMALRIFNRQLEGQLKRMDIQGQQAYNKAMERYNGDDAFAGKKLMKSALLYRKWYKKLDEFRTNLDDVQFQLSTAHDMNNFDDVGDDMLKNLCELKLTLGNPQIQKMLDELDVGYGLLSPIYADYIKDNKLTETLQPLIVTDLEIDQEFGEIPKNEESEAESAMDDLPDAPGSSENESDLIDLEQELARLRKKRNG